MLNNKVPTFHQVAQASLEASNLPPDSRREINELLKKKTAEEQYMGNSKRFVSIYETVMGDDEPDDEI